MNRLSFSIAWHVLQSVAFSRFSKLLTASQKEKRFAPEKRKEGGVTGPGKLTKVVAPSAGVNECQCGGNSCFIGGQSMHLAAKRLK